MDCADIDGYRYQKCLMDILEDKTPSKFHVQNPYAIHNINLFIKINNFKLQLIDDIYKGSGKQMNWRCECGDIFSSSWDGIRNGKKFCNFCARSKRWNNKRDYTDEVLQLCEQNNYKLITPYIHRSTTKFEYECGKHGIKVSSYHEMKSGRRCLECGIISRGKMHRKSENSFKELVESKGFIYVGCDYENSNSKAKKANIHILCPNHLDKGIQKVKYDNLRQNRKGCAYCIGRHRNQADLQKELDEMHGLVTILDYTTYASPIKAQCNICNSEWMTSGVSLTQGHRCHSCSTSNFEMEAMKLLEDWRISYTLQYRFDDCRNKKPLPFDFYLDDFNILIETDGEGHYIPIPRGSMSFEDAVRQLDKTKFHDKIKDEFCYNNNIPLIRIPHWERGNMAKFLRKKLSEYNVIITAA